MNQKKKQLKKEGKSTMIEEDDPEVVTEFNFILLLNHHK